MAAGLAWVASIAITPAVASAASFHDDSVEDFAAGSPGSATWVVEPGSVRLAPTMRETFDDVPAGWTVSPWDTDGAVTALAGSLTVDGAYLGSSTAFSPGQVLEFRAAFGSDANQHVGFADGSQTWALFSTWNGGGVYARTRGLRGDSQHLFAFAGSDPSEPHTYRIEWTADGVKYSVDGGPAVLQDGIPDDMELEASDLTVGGAAVKLDWMALAPYGLSGAFVSRVFDAGDTRAVWGALTESGSGAGIPIDTRSSVDGTTFSDWAPVGDGGAIASPPGRFIQYRANLSTSDPQRTPSLERVEIGYDVDTVAPTVTMGAVQVSGSTATAAFTSAAGDVDRFECKLDDDAYNSCTSPHQFTGVGVGAHTIRVRAVDTTGNVGDAAEQAFTVAGPPPSRGDDTLVPLGGGAPAPDTTAPRMAFGARTLRVSKSGKVGLKLTCPAGETRCNVSVRLRLGRSTLARGGATIAGARSSMLSLTLSRAARKRLAKARKLKLSAVVVATDTAGNRSTVTTALTLRA